MKAVLMIEPVPKARAKVVMKHGKVWSYTPKATKDTTEAIRTAVLAKLKTSFPQYTPVKLSVTFYRTKPPSTVKKELIPVRKPDLDNYIKTILDALNGIAFYDDSQITAINASKRWSDNGSGHIDIELIEDTL